MSNATEGLSPKEAEAVQLISSEGGIHQSELWKALDISSREGTRIARTLEEQGIISREETVFEGRVTYLLEPKDGTENVSSEPSSDPDSAVELSRTGNDELAPREQRAMDIIRRDGGVYQSELWKLLDVNSRAGSRIAKTLSDKGFVDREEVVYNGHRTFFLKPKPDELDFSLLMAGDMMSPFVGADEVDPIESDAFTQWLFRLTEEPPTS